MSGVDDSTGHESKNSETDNFLENVGKSTVSGAHGSKRPESVREHTSNYRKSVGYI